MEIFRLTADAKAAACAEHVKDLLEDSNEKFLVFAHHQVLLNKIEEKIKAAKFPVVRISHVECLRYADPLDRSNTCF